jgi:hypothetical protein
LPLAVLAKAVSAHPCPTPGEAINPNIEEVKKSGSITRAGAQTAAPRGRPEFGSGRAASHYRPCGAPSTLSLPIGVLSSDGGSTIPGHRPLCLFEVSQHSVGGPEPICVRLRDRIISQVEALHTAPRLPREPDRCGCVGADVAMDGMALLCGRSMLLSSVALEDPVRMLRPGVHCSVC